MDSAEKFWKWFNNNYLPYEQLDKLDEEHRDKLFDDLESELHRYCDHLYFEVGNESEGPNELIITAEGNVDYFPEVERLIATAPFILNWEFVAFKQQIPGHFKTEYDHITLDTYDLYFNPSNGSDELGIVIIVYIKEYKSEYEDGYYNCLFKMFDTILGEKAFALNIKKVIINLYDPKFSDGDVIPILKLPNYIKWYKSKNK